MKYPLEKQPAEITYTDCVLKFKVNLFASLITNQITWVILN
jgi:hypothetical protein